jgi:hypothetical protein
MKNVISILPVLGAQAFQDYAGRVDDDAFSAQGTDESVIARGEAAVAEAKRRGRS